MGTRTTCPISSQLATLSPCWAPCPVTSQFAALSQCWAPCPVASQSATLSQCWAPCPVRSQFAAISQCWAPCPVTSHFAILFYNSVSGFQVMCPPWLDHVGADAGEFLSVAPHAQEGQGQGHRLHLLLSTTAWRWRHTSWVHDDGGHRFASGTRSSVFSTWSNWWQSLLSKEPTNRKRK